MSEGLFRFANTEQAEAVGQVMSLKTFPTLVREYFRVAKEVADLESQHRAAAAAAMRGAQVYADASLQSWSDQAARLSLLREAIEAFLELPSAAGCGAQANPATPG